MPQEKGSVVYLKHVSSVLKNNPLGDTHIRNIPVYLPPHYEKYPHKRYPVIFGLTGFTGFGEMYLNKSFLTQSFDEMLDELINKKEMPEVIFIMPNCLTSLGGSQYVNSSAVGRYEDFIVQELVPYIDNHFQTNGQRGCVGGSSGGIGSFSLAAKYPNIFQAFASHSGDSAFEYCYFPDFPKFIQQIKKYDYKLENFIRAIPEIQPKDENFLNLLNITAMSASYSPNIEVKPLGFELPFDIYSGKINFEVWKKWLAFDPIHMVEKYQDNLKKLKFCYIDCGQQDQFNLFLGARQLKNKLTEFGIKHVYDEYDSDHFLLRRMQKKKSIPLMLKALNNIS